MKNRGITLIALVITIIILLILAGITISALTGENGLFIRSKDAKIATRASTVEEQKNLWIYELSMEDVLSQIPMTEIEVEEKLEAILTKLEAEGLLTADEAQGIRNDTENRLVVIKNSTTTWEISFKYNRRKHWRRQYSSKKDSDRRITCSYYSKEWNNKSSRS